MLSPGFSEQAHIKRRAQTLILGLKDRFDEIYSSDFPTESPKFILDLLDRILTQLSRQIKASSDTDFLSLICQLTQSLGEYLEFLDNANTEQTPRGLVQILEDVLETIDPSARLLAWPQAEYNYSIIDIVPILRKTVSHVFPNKICDEIFHDCPGSLNLISFPRIERDNILVHSVFGHELGHPIADEFLQDYELTAQFQNGLKSAAAAAEADKKEELSKLTGIKLVDAKRSLVKSLIQMHRRGIQELLSDCIAALIFGPSALFASYDVLQPDGLDHAPAGSAYYPPSRMRLRVINQLLQEEGLWDALNGIPDESLPEGVSQSISDFYSHISSTASTVTDKNAINGQPLLNAAYTWVEETLPDAINYARKRTKGVRYAPEIIEEEIPELLDRLYLGVPPNEVGTYPDENVANWRSAILAAWLYQLTGHKVEGQHIIDLTEPEIKKTHTLTLVAIEYIILKSKYKKHIHCSGI